MDEMSLSGSTGAQGGVDTNDPEKAQGDVAALKAAADAKAARIDGSGVGLAGALSIVLGLHF